MSYSKNTWASGDKVTAAKLNNIETGISNNDTEIGNLKSSIDEQSDRIDDADDILTFNNNSSIRFKNEERGFVRYDTGAVIGTDAFRATNYVDVSQFSEITYKRVKETSSSSTVGMAFYTSAKVYISGEICLRSQSSAGYTESIISVPSTAKYARFTMFTDTSTYGDFSLYGKSKLFAITTAHTEAFANEPTKTWFLDQDKPQNKYWGLYSIDSVTVNYGSILAEDTTRFIYNSKSYHVIRNDTSNLQIDLIGNADVVGVSKIKLICYIEDITKITSFTFQIIGTTCERGTDLTKLVNGWNEVEIYPHQGNLTTWSACTRIRLSIGGTSGRSIWVDSVMFLKRPKAPVIFIEDGGYTSFAQIAQPEFDALNAPVTWALDPKQIDDDTANISASDMQPIFQNGNVEFSFHSYAGTTTSNMTAAQLIEDTERSLRWLRKNGLLPKFFWRAAFTQNNAPQYMAIANIVPVLATHSSSNALDTFPFINPLDVPRIALHGQTTATIDELFSKMQKTHCTAVFYTHGIGEGSYNTPTEVWEYFLEKLTTAISSGYVEPTTYNRLMTGDGYI